MISIYNFPYLLRTTALELKPNAFIETGCKTLSVDDMIGYIISYTLTPEQEKKIRDRFGISGPVKQVLPDMNQKYDELIKILPNIFNQYNTKLIGIQKQLTGLTGGGNKKNYFVEEQLLFSNYTNMDKIGYIMSGGALSGIEQLDKNIQDPANQVSDLIDSFGDIISQIGSRITTLSGSDNEKDKEISRLNAEIAAAKKEGEDALEQAKAQHAAALEAAKAASDEAAAQQVAVAEQAAKDAVAAAQQQINAANAAAQKQKEERASDAAKFAAILGQLKSALEDKKTALEGLVTPTTGGAILKSLNNLAVLPKMHTGGMDAGKLRDNYHKIKNLIAKNSGIYSKMVGGNADLMGLGMQGINNYSDMRSLIAQSLGMTQQPMPMSGQQMVPALFQQYSNQLLQNDPLRAAIMQQIPAMKFQ